ncbi:hypothetical protein GF354_04840 [Candidatus Peregrinibacteria bacterium]|nr:hypothetical protein [Candidatus Peregrinibacteria bacterium]
MAEQTAQNESRTSIEEKPFLTGNLLNTMIFMILGVASLVGIYYVEASLFSPPGTQDTEFTEFSYSQDNVLPGNAVVRFDTEATNDMLVKNDSVFELKSGHVWVNTEADYEDLNILIDKVVLIPKNAIFDLNFDGRKLNISVFMGDVYLGFLEEGVDVDEYLNEYSDVFMASMLVPYGNSAEFQMKKINETLGVLLYSKLTKELKLSFVPSTKFEEQWVIDNESKDNKHLSLIKQNLSSRYLRQGLKSEDSFIGDALLWFEESLTFVPEKKENLIFERLFTYLNDAIYLALDNDKVASNEKLTAFDYYFDNLPESIKNSTRYSDTYSKYLNDLLVFGFNDNLYSVLDELLKKEFLAGRNRDMVLTRYWKNIYDSINSGFVELEANFNVYTGYLDQSLNVKKNDDDYVKFVTFQNQLLDNLILKFSQFYKKGYFVYKSKLEQKYLDLYGEGRVKDEIVQSLISTKINQLKRLRFFFFEEEVSVDDAKAVISRLNTEIFDLLPDEESELAVIELFENQLKDLDVFWAYLEASEYSLSRHYGATHRERYQVFLEDREILTNVEQMLGDVLGEDIGDSETVVEAEEYIKATLLAEAEVSQVEVKDLTDPDQRFVEISAVIGGYPFEAMYDRYYDNLREIYAFDELISERAIKINGLLPILKSKFADFAEIEEGEEETIESYASRVARTYIADQIRSYGFIVELADISVVDETQAVYRVNQIVLDGYERIVVTFDYTDKEVRNLLLAVNDNPIILQGPYTLAQLKDMIMAEDDFSAVIEAEKAALEEISSDDGEIEEVEESEGELGIEPATLSR